LEKSEEATANLGDRRKSKRREHAKELLVHCCWSIWVKIPVNVLSSSAIAMACHRRSACRLLRLLPTRVFLSNAVKALALSLSLSLSLAAARKRFLGENVTLLYYIAAFLDES
jgi:hypothetical protein